MYNTLGLYTWKKVKDTNEVFNYIENNFALFYSLVYVIANDISLYDSL